MTKFRSDNYIRATLTQGSAKKLLGLSTVAVHISGVKEGNPARTSSIHYVTRFLFINAPAKVIATQTQTGDEAL
jgi:hypothetical protein